MLTPERYGMKICIPGKPQGKARPRFTRAGRAYTPSSTREYENLIRLQASRCMASSAPIEGPVSVTIVAHFAPPSSYSKKRREACLSGCEKPAKKPDLDNVVKAVLDGMNGIIFRDDSQVVQITASKTYGASEQVSVYIAEEGKADD